MSTDPPTAPGSVWFRRSPSASRPRVGPHAARTRRTPAAEALPSADAVWGLLEEPRTFAELVSILTDAWGRGGRIASEVDAVLSDFIERGLVQAVADGDG